MAPVLVQVSNSALALFVGLALLVAVGLALFVVRFVRGMARAHRRGEWSWPWERHRPPRKVPATAPRHTV